jgi:hypothetical protein
LRLLAVLAAAAVAIALLPVSMASAQDNDVERDYQLERVDDLDNACPEPPPRSDYVDRGEIPEVHVFNVDCITDRGIAEGRDGNRFDWASDVRRDQMAAFIARTLDDLAADIGTQQLPEQPEDQFDDIANSFARDDINRLAEADIIAGFGDGTYRPEENITRDQVATFLLGAAAFAVYDEREEYELDDQRFPDVDSTNVHFTRVNGGQELGLIQGQVDGNYEPREPTRRGQMASMVARLLATIRTAVVPPDAPEIDVTIEDETATIGETVTATATVTDSDGDPAAGVDIEWSYEGEDGAQPQEIDADEQTDAQGQATADFTSPSPGTVTVTGTVTVDGQEIDDSDSVEFVVPNGPPDNGEPDDDFVLEGWNFAIDSNGSGTFGDSNGDIVGMQFSEDVEEVDADATTTFTVDDGEVTFENGVGANFQRCADNPLCAAAINDDAVVVITITDDGDSPEVPDATSEFIVDLEGIFNADGVEALVPEPTPHTAL